MGNRQNSIMNPIEIEFNSSKSQEKYRSYRNKWRKMIIEQKQQEQNEHLEAISNSLDNLKVMSTQINEELKTQYHLIDELDKTVDNAQWNLDRSLSMIHRVLRTKKPCYLWTILILSIIAIVLFVLIWI